MRFSPSSCLPFAFAFTRAQSRGGHPKLLPVTQCGKFGTVCDRNSRLLTFLLYQDAGYGEKSLFSCEDDNDDSESKNIDDEVW